MAIAETAKLMSSLTLDTKGFDSGVAKASKGLGQLQTRTIAAGTAIGVGLERLAEKGLSALGGAIGEGIQGALTLEKAQAQTQAVIESTGHAAGVTAVQVRDMANALEDVTTVDDKTIQQAENLLLTFTSIGKDIFPAATAAATNMAIAFNKGDASTADLDSAAIQLGKALNDPAAGFAALKRSGVSFSDAQIKILKGTNSLDKAQQKNYATLLKTDKKAAERYKAGILASKQLASQKLILAELDKEFGKAGTAAGTGFAADISRANDAIDDAKISIAQGLMPALGEVARELATTFKDPKVIQGLKDFGTGIGGAIKTGVAFIKTVPWDKIASALGTAAGFAKDLVNAFLGLPTWVQTAVITGWGLNKITGGLITDLASGLIKGVLGINAGVVQLTAGTVIGGGGAVPAGPPGWNPTAGGSGGISGLIKGIPIIGAALAGAELANVAAPIIAEKIKGVVPEVSGGIAAGATTAIVGALTGPLGFPNLISGIQSIAGNIADIIPLIDANKNTPTGEQDIEKLRAGIDAGLHPKDIEALRGTIEAGLAPLAGVQDIETLRAGVASDLDTLKVSDQTGFSLVSAATDLGAHQTSIAATQAGFGVARQTAASGFGIEQAIHSIDVRPIITVQISATDVTNVKVVEDRGGSRSGSRDGDGGGGPGQ